VLAVHLPSLMLVMLLVAPLVPFLLATRVAANPFAIRGHSSITLPITKRVDTSGAYNPIQRDQQRRRSLMERGRLPVINVPLNNTVFAYTASIGVGASATPCECFFVKFLARQGLCVRF
jgi:hypothetical protein